MCIINTGSNINLIFYYKTYRIFCLSHLLLVAKFRFDFDNLNNFALVVIIKKNYKIIKFYIYMLCTSINIIFPLKRIKRITMLLSLIISLMTTHTHIGHANGTYQFDPSITWEHKSPKDHVCTHTRKITTLSSTSDPY